MSTLFGSVTARAQRADDPALVRQLESAQKALQLGQKRRATTALRRAMRSSPHDARPVLALVEVTIGSEAHGGLARPSSAVLREAVTLTAALESMGSDAPDVARALVWLGAVRGPADAALERAAAVARPLDEGMRDVLREVAALFVLRDDLRAAESALVLARRITPHDGQLMTELAAVLLAQGRPTDAIPLLRARLEHGHDDDVLRDLAGALLAAGDAREAVALYTRLVASSPRSGPLQLELAHAALEAGELDQAVDAARRSSTWLPARDVRAHLVLGAALLRATRMHEARQAFEEVLRRSPGHPRASDALRAMGE